MANLTADVVIVGAGVAGLLPAYKLAAAGVDVLVLEAGPTTIRAEALEQFRHAVAKVPESPWPRTDWAPNPTVIALDEYYVQVGPEQFKSTYIRAVGGTTLHWLGTSMRHLPNDFRIQTLYGVGVDWPITYEELEPWYLKAEAELGIAGDATDDLGSPRSGGFPLPPLPLSYLDKQLAMAVKPLGLSVRLTPQARNSIYYDGRPPCCGNATCVPICPIQAKYDATVHARKAEQLGARILPNSVVYLVDVNNEGLVTQVRFRDPERVEHTATGKIFVLTAHAIETPKILLMSRTDALPDGVANSSGAVGRYLMDHPVQLSWALAKEPLYPYRSPLENAGIEDYRDGNFRSEYSAFRMAVGEEGWSFPGIDPTVLASDLISQGFRGRALREQVNYHTARQIRFANLMEQMPLAENRVTPAWDQPDAVGIPRPQIDYRLDPLTIKGMAIAREVSERVFNALGVITIEHSDTFFGAGHVIGTHRMGDDPGASVVDREQRCHDHPNLFLLGSGNFPTSATANPTLTIAALSLWAAQTIENDLRTIG